jgi:hypothetical protein
MLDILLIQKLYSGLDIELLHGSKLVIVIWLVYTCNLRASVAHNQVCHASSLTPTLSKSY